MTRRTTFFAKLMLVVWLAATNHAVFEVAGLMDSEFSPRAGHGQQHWHKVAENLTKQKTELSTKPAKAEHMLPIIDALLAYLQPQQPPRVERPPLEAAIRAFHVWHFDQRAAPLPGAPSPIV